ncbi:MAG: hypothetical protein HZC40_16650 [Chloroflexi bacterium]|nr:hypothetical protein [Chloroflexota bacterium]
MRQVQSLFERLSLAQQFVLTSFIILVCLMFAVGWWVARQIEVGVINRTAGQTALYVDSFIDPVLQETIQGAMPTSEHKAKLSRLVEETELGKHIVAFKVWDTQGRILYSTNPALIGKEYPVQGSLARALRGEVVASISDLDDEENVLERVRYSQLLETYSPINRSGTDQVIAVVEFYQTLDALRSGQARKRHDYAATSGTEQPGRAANRITRAEQGTQ